MKKFNKLIVLFLFSFQLCSTTIIIVGSGSAGLAAATKLLQNNITDILILEAENRIGGRIQSVNFGSAYVDLGAEFCDGKEDNVVYNMLKEYNILKEYTLEPNHNIFYSTGIEVDKDLRKQLFDIVERIYTPNGNRNQSEGRTIGEYCIDSYLSEIRNLNLNQKLPFNITYDFLDFFHHFVIFNEGGFSWFEPSAESDYRDTPGIPSLWNGKGFKTLLDIMTQKLPQDAEPLEIDDKIILNKTVESIYWENSQDNVIINCSDGSSYQGDQVIFTPSIGVLKHTHRTMFKPELPLEKQLAIERLGINAICKVMLLFPTKWWPENFPGLNFVWSAEHKKSGFRNFIKNGKTWILGAAFILPVDNNPNVLSIWFTGRSIPDIEQLPENELLEGVNFILKIFLENSYQLSFATSLKRSQFYTNPHFRGTYSYQTIASRQVKSNEDLAKPVFNKNGKLKLMFAGEATHSKYYSSVHGAIETGYREANRLLLNLLS